MPIRAFLILLTAIFALAPHIANAAERCSITLKPETSGFFLNPTLKKVLVQKATIGTDGKPCELRAGDEILQINEQQVVGQRANTVMNYWKGLSKDKPRVFTVNRDGKVIAITIR